MRKLSPLSSLLFAALLALPASTAHAGLGSLFKAAGSFADDAAKAGAKAGSHADDAALGARHMDDGARHVDDGAIVVDSAAHGDDARFAKEGDARFAKDGDSIAGDVAEQVIGIGADLAGGQDAPEKTATSPVDRETFKHARRLALLDGLDRVARQTNDAALATKAARIREKERVRHIDALTQMTRKP